MLAQWCILLTLLKFSLAQFGMMALPPLQGVSSVGVTATSGFGGITSSGQTYYVCVPSGFCKTSSNNNNPSIDPRIVTPNVSTFKYT